MYGMIHRAILQMVQERAAPAQSQALEARHGPSAFISAAVYEDALTVELLSAAAAAAGQEMDAFMFDLGAYWVKFADEGPYSGIMKMGGDDLVQFIGNLDLMHNAVRQAMPDARTPFFRVINATGDEITVGYNSSRQGLGEFVRGLLVGLSKKFGRLGEAEIIASEPPELCFRLRLGPLTR